MKKIQLIIVLCVCCTFSGMAQLEVDTNGRAIFSNYPWNRSIYIQDNINPAIVGTSSPFSVVRDKKDMVNISRAGDIYIQMLPSGNVGIGAIAKSINPDYIFSIDGDVTDYHGCLVRLSGFAPGMEGVRVEQGKSNAYPFVAYYGSSIRFQVDGSGTVYSNGVALTSDFSLKRNIEPIAGSLNKVMQLQGIRFDYNFPDDDDDSLSLDDVFESAKKRTPALTREIFDQIQQEKSRKRMGVVAQDVEKVLPELVRTREDGLKAVFYPEMVAVLIEAMKEQQLQIEALQAEVLKSVVLRSATDETETPKTIDPIIAQCKLYQNAPNPFSQNTQIKYSVSEGVKKALLCIYDLQGSQIKQISITERGEGSQTISGSELSAGMYLYALIANGKEVDVKRMILTK